MLRISPLVTLACVICWSAIASAQSVAVDCNTLVRDATASAAVPRVTLDPDWGVVRIATPERQCREPAEKWRRRGLAWPVKNVPGSERPSHAFLPDGVAATRNPPVPVRSPRVARPAPQPVATRGKADLARRLQNLIALPVTPKTAACDAKIEDFWTSGYHSVDGVDYLLTEARTIDGNGDGVADNLQFKLVAHDRSQLTIRVFERRGRRSASDVRSLNISPNLDVARFCPARVAYSIPVKTSGTISIAPGLKGQVKARMRPSDDLAATDRGAGRPAVAAPALGWPLGIGLAVLASGLAILFGLHRGGG